MISTTLPQQCKEIFVLWNVDHT